MGNLEIPSISCALVRGSGEYRNAQPRPKWGTFSPTSGSSRETGVNGANTPRRGTGADSETRLGISRSPADPMRSAADPGVSLMRIPAPSRNVSETSGISREIGVNGTNPPRREHGEDSPIRSGTSRFPEYPSLCDWSRIRRVAYFARPPQVWGHLI